jgi:vancomycin permeability regulator SanA
MKRKIAFTFLLVALLVLAAIGMLVWSGMNDHLGKADLALVLGNKVNPDGSPSARLKARLDTAADLYRKGWFPKILVSGGTGKEGFPEGTAMKNYLVGVGLPEAAILVDNEGVDTQASVVNTAAVLRAQHGKSVFVITQYFHIPRTRLALSRLPFSTRTPGFSNSGISTPRSGSCPPA